MKKQSLFALLALSLFTAGCSTSDKLEDGQEIVGSVELLYNKGMDEMTLGTYSAAVQTFEELQRQHPYSGWATRAEMMIIYAHYRKGEYDETVASANRFMGAHPGHADLPYVYFLKGMAFYDRIQDVRRDQRATLEAYKVFGELLSRFPESEYARNAKLKMTLCRDHLAGQEMEVGFFYLNEQRYIAAVNRFRFVLENYETSSHTPEALYRLTEGYLSLGLRDEAQASAAILGHNFPKSQWYIRAYELMTGEKISFDEDDIKESTWMDKLFQGKPLFGDNAQNDE